MGEPAGIGPDVTIAAWQARKTAALPPFFVIGPPALYAARAKTSGAEVTRAEIGAADEAADRFADALPVLARDAPDPVPGRPSAATAEAVIGSIDTAVRLALDGSAAAVVTNPIQKAVLMEAGFAHPGHTEYLAALARGATGEETAALMLLAVPGLRVVPLIVHEPLTRVPELIEEDRIVAAGLGLDAALRRDFAVAAPRIAVAGLNPHAGEDGRLGREETEIIAPAVARLRDGGIDARGPFPADSLFHEEARATYDAALCMYHDQALIPLKTLNFHEGVNVPLELPFVRTSPDHGTALDIAGTGRADARSLCAALKTADKIARQRRRAATAAA